MGKKDISKILTTGSLKQRLLLVAEQRARDTYGKERILTDHELNELSDSFKKSNEIKLWNEWNRHAVIIVGAISNLQGLSFEVQVNYSNLRGYILVWNTIENAELLANSILHEIKDTKERKRVAESGAKGVDLIFSKAVTDNEGYIDIQIEFERRSYKGKKYNEEPDVTKEYGLLYVMNNVKAEATNSIIRFLSWRQATLDYIEETGFNVKTYTEIIEGLTNRVYAPIIGWAKYSGEIETGLSHPQVEKLIKKYAITPKIEDLKVDERLYNAFKKDYLGDE